MKCTYTYNNGLEEQEKKSADTLKNKYISKNQNFKKAVKQKSFADDLSALLVQGC